jgi:hypothetical protein
MRPGRILQERIPGPEFRPQRCDYGEESRDIKLRGRPGRQEDKRRMRRVQRVRH